MLGGQLVAGSDTAGGSLDVDSDAGQRLILALGQLHHLLVGDAEVALKIELVGASDYIVGVAVDQAGNGRSAILVIHDGLPQGESGATEGIVQRDAVCVGVYSRGIEVFLVGVDRDIERILPLQVDGIATAGLQVRGRQFDQRAFVERRVRVVCDIDHVVCMAVAQAADVVAARVAVIKRVLGQQGVMTDVDRIGEIIDITRIGGTRTRWQIAELDDGVFAWIDPAIVVVVELDGLVGIVDLADVGFLGHQRIDLDLDQRRGQGIRIARDTFDRVHIRFDSTVHTGIDIRVGHLDTERQTGGTVGEHAGTRTGAGFHLTTGLDIGGLARGDAGPLGDRYMRGDIGVGNRQGHRNLAAGTPRHVAQVALGLGFDFRLGGRIRGDDHGLAGVNDHTGLYVHRGFGRGPAVSDAEQLALGHTAAICGGAGIHAHGIVADQIGALSHGHVGGGPAHQDLGRQSGQVVQLADHRTYHELIDHVVDAVDVGEAAILALCDQIDTTTGQRGACAYVHGDMLVLDKRQRGQVFQLRYVQAARTEHDVVGIGRIDGITRRQGDTIGYHDVVGKGFQIAAAGGDAAGEGHRVYPRIFDRTRIALMIAIQQQVGCEVCTHRVDGQLIATAQ